MYIRAIRDVSFDVNFNILTSCQRSVFVFGFGTELELDFRISDILHII